MMKNVLRYATVVSVGILATIVADYLIPGFSYESKVNDVEGSDMDQTEVNPE